MELDSLQVQSFNHHPLTDTVTIHYLFFLLDGNDCYACLNSPHRTAPSCMYYHRLQSRRFPPGCCWSWRSPLAISEPGFSAWCHVESWDLSCPLAACSSVGSPHWGVCSSARFPSKALWPEGFSSESPPPGSSAGWAHGGMCSPIALTQLSVQDGCMLGWWHEWWAIHQTRVEVLCTHILYGPLLLCPCPVSSILLSPSLGQSRV